MYISIYCIPRTMCYSFIYTSALSNTGYMTVSFYTVQYQYTMQYNTNLLYRTFSDIFISFVALKSKFKYTSLLYYNQNFLDKLVRTQYTHIFIFFDSRGSHIKPKKPLLTQLKCTVHTGDMCGCRSPTRYMTLTVYTHTFIFLTIGWILHPIWCLINPQCSVQCLLDTRYIIIVHCTVIQM